ncbi:mucin-2 isoform X9 [Stomoxys calcitrans]|uniref:mucin-2 isoform X9 n=1 Tax=Stomoxys calcitrans TaxID=35570 RepID=UPI0027E28286|nr:mucin-2 isoform X9 [Stomoxys calcitrans]
MMELECDLSKIQSEELLRKMWQQSEDVNRKKEIRSQLYKLRESRLRDLYQYDAMSDNRVAGFGKDPLAPSHGESLADQSFQSLKSKEIRDSMSPTEMKFQSMALNNPNNTGWNVQSSSEVTPDGRGFRAETIATTDGVENINGGTAEFKGRNEQRSSAMHEGDDKNFRKQASESSKTHLQEKVVIGDENSGRTEIRTSSSTSTSSSKVFQSSSTTEYENGQPVAGHHQPQYLMDSNRGAPPQRMQHEPQYPYEQQPRHQQQQQPQYHPQPTQYEPQYEPQEVRRATDQQQYTQQTEQYNRNRHETNTSQNVQTNETHEQNKRYVDMDKASPEYQRHVQHLMAQPGEIISNTVEYPKPNVKMITTVKRLPDGTIVRNKRYETEETSPTSSSTPVQHTTNTRQTVTNQNTQRRDSQTHHQQEQPKNYQGHAPSERLRRPNDDVVDNVDNTHRYTHDDSVETKYSTVKTSNRKFSTETTSETIQEYDDGYSPSTPSGSRPKAVTNDFSTHGFPSVRPNKPTQEFATDRPQAVTNDFSTHGFPSVRPNKPTQEFATDRPQPQQMRPNQSSPSQRMTSPPKETLVPVRGEYEPSITERRIPTEDGEVIIVSSEKKRSVKHQTNSERIIETDIRSTDDNRYQQITDVTNKTNNTQDFSTHGFPSAREPQTDIRQLKPHSSAPGYAPAPGSTPGYPSSRPGYAPAPGSTPVYPSSGPGPNDDDVIVTSQKTHSTKYNTNTERIIETEILGDDGRPLPRGTPRSMPADVEYITDRYTVTTPGGDQIPQPEYPAAGRPSPSRDFSTQGFPSARSPNKSQPDYSTQGFPSARDTHRPSGTAGHPQMSPTKTQPSPSAPTNRKPTPTMETTERIIQKEKEVDAAHRAFAASLRSSSPVDQTRRDSTSTDGPRHTPRSSVSSTKTFRREVREGSHDSETSRVSTTTVTRQTPPRSVGGRTVVVSERITSSPSPRGTKSPSPGKTVSTTTTTTPSRTATSKPPVKDVPKPETRPPIKKTPTPYAPKTKGITTTDSVAARRSLFENHQSPKSPATPKRPTPTSSPSTGRRPSYMDHTKSSLEHIRRDSLELNKNNYSRRPSDGDYEGTQTPNERNSQVKFEVSHHRHRPDMPDEDINIEEIFELTILERLLETVTSYELRRRIRAQIRLVKKNLSNVERNTATTTNKQTNLPERSHSPRGKAKPHTIESHVSTTSRKHLYREEYSEEEHRSSTSTHTSPDRGQIRVTKITRASPSDRRSPSPQNKTCGRPHDRSPSPVGKTHSQEYTAVETSTKKHYTYKNGEEKSRRPMQYYPIDDDVDEEVQRKETSPTVRRPHHGQPENGATSPGYRRSSRKSVSPSSSPERHQVDNSKYAPRSGSPQEKRPSQPRVGSKSPDNRSGRYEQSPVTSKPQTKRTPTTPITSKAKPESKAPVWADRKNVLKSPGNSTSTTPTSARKPIPATDSRITSSSVSRTIKSSTNQSLKHSTTNKSSYVEDDCITSSYGIGPTDENGLPLFGIRALKKKKQPVAEPCETTEEVTGYVVEEKYYSDNKSKPIVERKELIYSTNPDELKAIKERVKDTSVKSIKSERLEGYDDEDSAMYATKTTTTSVRSSPEDFLETKYVRRGSVKEMSEKFIHKESSSSVSEKVNNYPKAGLILRTNSRKQSRDNNEGMDDGNGEYYETRTQYLRDSGEDDECQMETSGHFIVESESETESIKKTQRAFKKITSTKSSSSRSFLNTKGEEKVVTSVDDVLDRMRNADNVVEEGDTAEDQEARALLNKFLGASIIMKGVESTIPINRETKIITTTTTAGGKQPVEKHEVKTTRVTKSIRSGSSSSPVIETTCDIEEIWDEEILKQLLEQAKSYEERRKIRSRLRELMADRTEKNSCQQTGKEEGEQVAATGANVEESSTVQRSESSASEYEEIVEIIEEEVTDDSSAEEEVEEKQIKETEETKETSQTKEAPKPEEKPKSPTTPEVGPEQAKKSEEPKTTPKETSESETAAESETPKESEDKTDSSEQDTTKQPKQQSSTSTTEKTETKGKDGAVVTTTTKVTTRTVSGTGPKTVSPFAKFKQLDRQSSQQSTKSPTTPTTPGGGSSASPSASGNAPMFKFTDPALNARAATVKEQLLQWCQSKTKEYENVQITNFSSSWVDGLAFCALIHHFLPDAFDYSQLTPKNRRHNFELAFTVADEKAGIAPLLDVEDMVVMKRPDWKCVFVYVQSIYRRFRNCQ